MARLIGSILLAWEFNNVQKGVWDFLPLCEFNQNGWMGAKLQFVCCSFQHAVFHPIKSGLTATNS